jgi:4-hydroxythreonine-4-phosphate dehydrogenase
MGDPKGVGPEIIAKAWKHLDSKKRSNLKIYGDRTALETAAELAGIEFDHKQMVITSSTTPPIGSASDPETARITKAAIDAAVADVSEGKINAIVTGPVNKFRLHHAAPNFVGHTEYLAQVAKVKDVVMMFASDAPCHPEGGVACPTQPLRVALATTHVSIKDVPQILTPERIVRAASEMHRALKIHFGCEYPRIGVLALNPHAGDRGALGSEEEMVITPAIELARAEGLNCIGPLVMDNVFAKIHQLDFDGIVAMYHDQGLIPMKLLYGLQTVNITLGLPFIRTSPAHGTAEDIAWRDVAQPESMLAAIAMAERMVSKAAPRS